MMTKLICLLSFVSLSAHALVPGEAVEFTELKAFHSKVKPEWGTALMDIVNHEAPGDSNQYDDLVTLGHETCHGIHSYIRNHMNKTGKQANGFYVLADRAVIVMEPKMRKSKIAAFVPVSLRGSRYATYITGQTAWDDTPLYVWDEWNAYVNGGEAGVDLFQKGLWKQGWRDAVAGIIEFVAYALATGQAVEKNDPDYFKNYIQFKEFLAWNIERSMRVFQAGRAMDAFKWDWQEKYYASLQTSSDAESLRTFARQTFGADWTTRVLGF